MDMSSVNMKNYEQYVSLLEKSNYSIDDMLKRTNQLIGEIEDYWIDGEQNSLLESDISILVQNSNEIIEDLQIAFNSLRSKANIYNESINSLNENIIN